MHRSAEERVASVREQAAQQQGAVAGRWLPLRLVAMTHRQVHSVFPASECVRAHELMDSGNFTGKIVLRWSE